jgi:hypothetical protein
MLLQTIKREGRFVRHNVHVLRNPFCCCKWKVTRFLQQNSGYTNERYNEQIDLCLTQLHTFFNFRFQFWVWRQRYRHDSTVKSLTTTSNNHTR